MADSIADRMAKKAANLTTSLGELLVKHGSPQNVPGFIYDLNMLIVPKSGHLTALVPALMNLVPKMNTTFCRELGNAILEQTIASTTRYFDGRSGYNRVPRFVLGNGSELHVYAENEMRDALKRAWVNAAGSNPLARLYEMVNTAYINTIACVMCNEVDGFYPSTGLPGAAGTRSGSLWFSTSQLTKAVITTMKHQVWPGPQMRAYCEIVGICHNCRYKCGNCGRMANLEFNTAEIASLKSEGLCVSCGSHTLVTVSPPKFNKGDFRRINRNLNNLIGG